MKFIKIFLASSAKMAEYRKLFEIDINRLNSEWVKKDMFLDLEIWEEFNEYMVKEGKQHEYNQSVTTCDIFVLLFSDFVGRYSKEEFNHAFECFSNSPLQVPRIFPYFIEPPDGIKDKSTEEFLAELGRLKHYPSVNKTFDEVRKKFQKELLDLTAKEPYFLFPDLTPRINEKVQYIKMLHLTDMKKNGFPVYSKSIERLQEDVAVYDEAQFYELVVYSGAGRSTLSNNYSRSAGTIDMNVIIPRQDTVTDKQPMSEDDLMKNVVRRNFDLDSNVFYSVTSFINAFQQGNTFYQTRADEPIECIRLIIDFSALPNHRKIQRTEPTATQYNEKNKMQVKEITVSTIKPGVYQAASAGLVAGDIVVMRFDIDWNEV